MMAIGVTDATETSSVMVAGTVIAIAIVIAEDVTAVAIVHTAIAM